MLSVEVLSKVIGSYKQKSKICFQEIQQEIEQTYNEINDSIDKKFTTSDLIGAQMSTSSFNISFKPLEIPSSLNNLKNELIQEIKPLVKDIVSKKVQKKYQQIDEINLKQTSQKKQKFKNLQEDTRREDDKMIKQLDIWPKQIITQSPFEYNLKPFKFQLMETNSIQQDDWCCAIAINKDNSIVVTGCEKQIKVYELKQEGKLNQIQLLTEHSDRVFTLNFMKQSNHFISGSDDTCIIIWQMIQNNQWTCQQKLNGHSSQILCLLLNNNEDLMISGSDDNSIKFWDKQKGWYCCQTIKDHASSVYSLSLNQRQDKLISCSKDSYILIIEQSQKDKTWSVIQKIKVDQYGYRLCFIDNTQFTFQPYANEQMYVYEMNVGDKQFVKIKEINVQSGQNSCGTFFPQQYIKQKRLLVNKNGQNINLIRKKQNGEFITEENISFNSYYVYGSLSDDGEYLITWDNGKQEIQIRKCNER